VGDYQDTNTFAAQQCSDAFHNTLLPHAPLQKFKKCAPAQIRSSAICASNFINRRKHFDRYLTTLAKFAGSAFWRGMVHACAQRTMKGDFRPVRKISRVLRQKKNLVRHSKSDAVASLKKPVLPR
jgi:hypothetical protein